MDIYIADCILLKLQNYSIIMLSKYVHKDLEISMKKDIPHKQTHLATYINYEHDGFQLPTNADECCEFYVDVCILSHSIVLNLMTIFNTGHKGVTHLCRDAD